MPPHWNGAADLDRERRSLPQPIPHGSLADITGSGRAWRIAGVLAGFGSPHMQPMARILRKQAIICLP